MTLNQTLIRIGLAGTALVALSSAGFAAPAVGLTGDRTLVWFDTATAEVTRTVELSGVERLHGIDMRPADGKLYGVDGDGAIVTIDLESGAATKGATMTTTLPSGVAGLVNFNPAADRLRVMGADGTNLRVNVDTGETTVDGNLNFAAGDPSAEATPMVVATAYTNGIGKPEKTAMYDIDAGLGALLRQTAPNDGTLATIGMLGIEGADGYAFDFEVRAIDDNVAWLASGGALYTVNLETGAAVKEADFKGMTGSLRDLAILSGM